MLPSLPLSFCPAVLYFLPFSVSSLCLYLWEMKEGEIEAAVQVFLHLSRKRTGVIGRNRDGEKENRVEIEKRYSWKTEKVKEGIEKWSHQYYFILFWININCFNFSLSSKKEDELEILKRGTRQIIRKWRQGSHWDWIQASLISFYWGAYTYCLCS